MAQHDVEWLEYVEDTACTHGFFSFSAADRARLVLLIMHDPWLTQLLASYNYSARPVQIGLASTISLVGAARDGIVRAVTERIVDSSESSTDSGSSKTATYTVAQGRNSGTFRRSRRGFSPV